MRFHLRSVWGILALAAPFTTAQLARAEEQPFSTVGTLVEQKMRDYGVPGVALGILHEGQISTRGFGITNIDHPLPVTEDTLFQVALSARRSQVPRLCVWLICASWTWKRLFVLTSPVSVFATRGRRGKHG